MADKTLELTCGCGVSTMKESDWDKVPSKCSVCDQLKQVRVLLGSEKKGWAK